MSEGIKISILLPVYNTPSQYLIECIESVMGQEYSNWELCIADDNSSQQHVKEILRYYSNKDDRVKVEFRNRNGHICECTNTAFAMATGEYCALLDHDDLLHPFALYEVARAIHSYPEAVLFYTDEDKWLDGKRIKPFYKKKWGYKHLIGINFICHLAVYRTSAIRQVEGFRVGTEGAQDWDLALRVMELEEPVVHIPKILYHWRISEFSTSGGEKAKDYIKNAQYKVIHDAMERITKKGDF
ncbi:glycosyltransferase family 2 protein [Paenibacillus pasadenensis]